MTRRSLGRYIDDLLAGRPPKPFRPDDFEAAQIRTAIDLQAAREGADEPRPEFLNSLESRLAAQMSTDTGTDTDATVRSLPSATRRQVIIGTTAAATAAVATASVERLLKHPAPDADNSGLAGSSGSDELVPTHGMWQPVAKSTDLAEGGVHAFDVGSVTGFVRRTNGRVAAVSGVCTHQGCRLWFDQSADALRCPCHVTSFSPAGRVITHQLPIAPKPLPQIEVREQQGVIEVLVPGSPGQPA